ncbi:MAG: AI-2E family transporter, partial [Acidobacteriota bacterium]|nr:AI-2E family transporter [Acidobacteriota bacterium]
MLFVSRGLLWQLVAIVAAFVLIWRAGEVLVVAFAGILLAVILRTLTGWIRRATHLPTRVSYLLVLFLLAGLSSSAVFLLGPRVVDQAGEIARIIPQSIGRAEAVLNAHNWGRFVTTAAERTLAASTAGARISKWADGLIEFAATLIVVAAIGLLAGLDPNLYSRRLIRFLPETRQAQVAT